MAHNVGVIARVVPDGYDAANHKYRVSVVLMPDTRTSSGTIALDDWPEQVSAAIAPMQLLIGTPGTSIPFAPERQRSPGAITAGKAIWNAMFPATGGPTFSNLYQALYDQQNAPVTANSRRVMNGAVVRKEEVLSHPGAVLANVVDAIYAKQTVYGHFHALWLNSDFSPSVISSAEKDAIARFYYASDNVSESGAFHRWPLMRSLADNLFKVRRVATAAGDVQTDYYATLYNSGAPPSSLESLVIKILSDLNYQTGGNFSTVDPRASFDPIFVKVLRQALQLRFASNDPTVKTYFKNPIDMEKLFFDLKLGDDDRVMGAIGAQTKVDLTSSARDPSKVISLDNPFAAVALFKAARRPDPVLTNALHPPNSPPPPPDEEDLAKRRLFGLMAQPSLAWLLGFIFDYTIDASSIEQAMAYDRICFAVSGDSPASNLYTGFKYVSGSHFFGPCPRAEYLGGSSTPADAPDGLLKLDEMDGYGNPRFILASADVTSVVQGNENASSARLSSLSKGQMQDNLSSTLATSRSAGLTLFDQGRVNNTLQQISAGGTENVLFAEDLTSGYRVDVARKSDSTRMWRSLTDRDVIFPRIDGSLFLPIDGVQELRNQGYVRGIDRVQQSADSFTNAQAIVDESLFSWTGQNLALTVPTEQTHDTSGPFGPDFVVSEYGTDIVYGLPRRRPTHPLRFGECYWIGMRRAYINGGSLKLDEAAAQYYNSEKGILGDGMLQQTSTGSFVKEAFEFLRRDPIPGPGLHLGEDDPLVETDSDRGQRGEQVNAMVLRDATSRDATRRYLTPARATFDLCEMHGVFDTSSEDTPGGAFGFLDLDQHDGTFPSAVGGRILHLRPDPSSGKLNNTPKGTVLRKSEWGDRQPDTPFYPDPWAQLCCFALFRDGKKIRVQSVAATFTAGQWPNVSPVILELRPTIDNEGNSKNSYVEPSLSVAEEYVGSSGWQSSAKVVVRIPPGERAELRVWSIPSSQDGMKLHQFAKYTKRAVDGLASGSPDAKVQSLHQTLQSVLANSANYGSLYYGWPIPNISGYRDIDVVHAVTKPTVRPAISSLNSVRIVPQSTGSATPVAANDNAWSTFVQKQLQDGIPQPWMSQEDASLTYFTGSLTFNRPSTGRLLAIGSWLDVSDDAAVFRDDSGKYHFVPHPIRNEHLFEISKIPYDGPPGATALPGAMPLDLLHDENGALRSRSYSFNDAGAASAARRVEVKLVATSRYTNFFVKESDSPEQFNVSSETFEIWVPNTRRPENIVVDRIVPLFSWSETGKRGKLNRTVTRSSKLRVFFKSKFHVTGEGEKLALVFSPDGSPTMINGELMVCGWGADPIRKTDSLPLKMRTSAIVGMPAPSGVLAGVPLPLPPLSAGGSSIPVAVQLFDPKLDPEEGLWYSDVELTTEIIDPNTGVHQDKVAWPFVRLALCRYQPHSIPNHELSFPTFEWVQLPPWRKVEVEATDYTNISVTVSGASQSQMKAAGDEANPRVASPPVFLVSLVRLVDDSHWLPVIEKDGTVDAKWMVPSQAPSNATNYIGKWALSYPLPERWYLDQFGLIVKEYEQAIQDASTRDPSESGIQAANLGEPVLHGPLFMSMVPLTEYSDSGDES